ncbi:RluA family pseudouridine synthase [Lactovum miscens]|uniref:Pseudouridine synthase n=1 Tax=Lactovum miscens TaxID=190387 RepID=A0A841CAF3_9LACT|nr:RluA family pseudouridine synthase [Lactovum miscens]MBB5888698.1 23S rRNA pseudouridine1911/1915/1917 synthase [Lactovum miscens]
MKVIIDEKNVGARLDKALSTQTKLSRTLLTELIRGDKVTVNDNIKKAKYKVLLGDVIEFKVPEAEVLNIMAEDIPLDIIYEDSDLAVINKPQGMVVHPSNGHSSGTLVNALMYQIKDLSTINGVVRPGIVHRIDKDTSGLLMVAKNDKAHESLAAQLKDQKNKRRYLAIVHGIIEKDHGTIDAPIGRNPKDRLRQAVVAGGKSAVTRFEVLERFPSGHGSGGFTLVACRLETGRTHQIRVHMAYIKHPIAGDSLYGPLKTLIPNRGQFLHAETLGLKQPTTGEEMEFKAELPEIFKNTIKSLRNKKHQIG